MNRIIPSAHDLRQMRHALGLARRGLGRVWPNPAVGCVLVNHGRVVGAGWTQPSGRPHAERVALDAAGDLAQGATAYVTLEPCSHHGKTPPCADALVAAGVARVVAACTDPDPRVSGRGLARLREAGIAVIEGVLADQARMLNAGFLSRVLRGRPWVTLKIASTLDGRIATATGESQWITGPRARAEGHRLRGEADAVLTGAGTLAADDPLLTARLPGYEGRQPVRIVLEGRAPVPTHSRIWDTAYLSPVWLLTARADAERDADFGARGVRVLPVAAGADGRPDPAAVLARLGEAGLTRLLVEAGSALNAALLAADLVDEIAWFRAPFAIGGDGLAAVGAISLADLAAAPRFRPLGRLPLDSDVLEVYQRDSWNFQDGAGRCLPE